jgi:hypothetical protein
MIPRERVLAALDRKPVDRVPFVEISVAFGISEKLLGRRLSPVSISPLPFMKIRTAEDDKALSRLIRRDHITYRLFAPTFLSGTEASLCGDGKGLTISKTFHLHVVYEPRKPSPPKRSCFFPRVVSWSHLILAEEH